MTLTQPAQGNTQNLKALYQYMQAASYTQAMRTAIKNKDPARLDELALELCQDYPDTAPYVAATIATERVFRHYRARFKCLQMLV